MVHAALLIGLGLAAFAQDAGADLRDAIYDEVALGRTEEALGVYRTVLVDETAGPDVRARALHRIAVCLAKLGRFEEAEEALRSLRERHPDSEGLHRRAADEVRRLKDGGRGVIARPPIEDLILTLASAEGERAREAGRMLAVLAPESIPHLEEALSHADTTMRVRAAEVLWALGDDAGFEPLRDAFFAGKAEVTLQSAPHVILSEMIADRPGRLDVFVSEFVTAEDPGRLTALLWIFRVAGSAPGPVVDKATEIFVAPAAASGASIPSVQSTVKSFLMEVAPLEASHEAAMAALGHPRELNFSYAVTPWLARAAKEEPYPRQMAATLLLHAVRRGHVHLRDEAVEYAQKLLDHREDGEAAPRLSPEQALDIAEAALFGATYDLRREARELLWKALRAHSPDEWPEETHERFRSILEEMKAAGGESEEAARRLALALSAGDEALWEELAGEAILHADVGVRVSGEKRTVREAVLLPMSRRRPELLRRALLDLVEAGEDDALRAVLDCLDLLPAEGRAEILARGIGTRPDEIRTPMAILRAVDLVPAEERGDLLTRYFERWPEAVVSLPESRLADLGDDVDVPALLRRVIDPEDRIFPLEDEDRTSRVRAIQLLRGLVGELEVVPDLIPLLSDRDEGVRDVAREALEEIRRIDQEKDEWWAWYRDRKSSGETFPGRRP